jgi:NAD(P)-dependent dehydrogenase (short-subunit alcohol dehydrogenase family)
MAAGIGVGSHEVPPAPGTSSSRQRFADKVVIITGGTSGIGRAAAIAFAREGARVAFCGRREALGREVELGIGVAGGMAHYFRADMRVESDVQRFVEFTVSQFGRLDVAFNNAGITLEKSLHEYSSSEWDDVLNTNLRGVFFAIEYQVPQMLASAGGTIVVTSSSTRSRRSPSVESIPQASAGWWRLYRPRPSITAHRTYASTQSCLEPIRRSCDALPAWSKCPTPSGAPPPPCGQRRMRRFGSNG